MNLEETRTRLTELDAEIANFTAEAERQGRIEHSLRETKRDAKAGRVVLELNPGDGELESHTVVTVPLPPAIVLELEGEGVRLVPQKGRELREIGEDQQEFETALHFFRTEGAPTAASKMNKSVVELMTLLDRGVAEWGPGEGPWPPCDPDYAAKLRGVYAKAREQGVEQLAQRHNRTVESVLGFLLEGARYGLFEWPPPVEDTSGDLVGGSV